MYLTPYRLRGTKNITAVKMIPRVHALEPKPKLFWAYIQDGTLRVASSFWDSYNRREEIENFGPAEDCAIAFNGYWERDYVSKRFFFVSEEYPWVFGVNEGELRVWRTDVASFVIAENVEKVDAVRGWIPAQAGHTQDQGLIVAYLKSGVAYYRNYALQENETYIWESEKEIEELPGGLTDIALFRTNDFRIGVLGRDSVGNVHMTVTVRNWAGMSLYPESFNASASIGDMSVQLTDLVFTEIENPDETFTAQSAQTYPIGLCPPDYSIDTVTTKTSSTSFTIDFGYPILHGENQESGFTVQGNREIGTMTINGNQVQLTLTGESDPLPTATITEVSYAGISFDCPIVVEVTSGCRIPMHSFTVFVPAEPPEVEENFTAEASVSDMNVTLTDLVFSETEYTEEDTFTAEASVDSVTIQMYDLEDNPI